MKEKTILFRVDEKEYNLIKKLMGSFRFRSVSEYCRFVALNTNTIVTSIKDIETSNICISGE